MHSIDCVRRRRCKLLVGGIERLLIVRNVRKQVLLKCKVLLKHWFEIAFVETFISSDRLKGR